MSRYLLIACVVLAGCDSGPIYKTAPACVLADSERRADFILKCAEAANPKSDEEGEDLVKQCQLTSEDLFCPLGQFKYNPSANQWERVQSLTVEKP